MDFSFIQTSDHHILDSETSLFRGFSTGYALQTVLQHIARNQAGKFDFLVMTGDLVNKPTPDAYRPLGASWACRILPQIQPGSLNRSRPRSRVSIPSRYTFCRGITTTASFFTGSSIPNPRKGAWPTGLSCIRVSSSFFWIWDPM